MTHRRIKRESPRQAARCLAKKLRGWISSALAGHCCPACGDAMGNVGTCSCGRCELDPATFEAEPSVEEV
jgi:hypothetical protein